MKKMLSAVLGALFLFACALPFNFFKIAAQENAPPRVIPAVREWEGGEGVFIPKAGLKLVLDSDELLSDAQKQIIREYFIDILGFDIEITSSVPPSDGDYYLTPANDASLGEEGYIIDAGEKITISADGEIGFLYGIITTLQSYYADGYMPKGKVRDWPMYEVRSGMIDVARAYIPLDYVEEITKYFAWFKLNEIHLHINDNGANGYNIFRLESDVPNLTAKDGYYTKDEYRDYQKRMVEYGVSVITEIDTPAHSRCFAAAVPEYMLPDMSHIDISNPDAVQFVLDLFDEYITGDDPVFVSKKVHFGTDEYPAGHNEEMRAYTDTLIKHIRERGYTPRFWGSFGGGGFNGTTPVSGDAEVNFWADSLSDYKTLFSMGYDIINSCSHKLYCVPGGNYGFPDYIDLKSLYKSWFINYMGYGPSTAVEYDNPQLKGASFCLWNDRHTEWGGFTMFDIFDRVRYLVAYVSEKTWDGEQTRSMDADDFVERFYVLSLRAGNTNPGRTAELPLDLDDVGVVKSVGFPYIFSADIVVNSYTDANIVSGEDGRLFINAAGKPSFTRETYTFNFNYVIPKNTKVNLKLYADNKRTYLIVNDTYYYDAINLKNPALIDSSTFVLPFEFVGGNGLEVKSLSVYKPDFNLNDKKLNANLALFKDVSVSGLEVDYGLNEPLAVDGNIDTRLSFARDKDVQWMVVDLGSEHEINKVVIEFHERVSDYEIYVSSDGNEYVKVYEIAALPDGVKATDEIEIEPVTCRYVKYVQLKRWYCSPYSTYYSGGIYEFEVYGTDMEKYAALVDIGLDLAEGGGSETSDIKRKASELNRYLKSESIYKTHIDALYDSLAQAIYDYENPPADVSSPSETSEVSQTSSPIWGERDGLTTVFLWIAAGVLAALIAFAVFALFKNKIAPQS